MSECLDHKLEVIKKCLRLAKSDNPNEAADALAKAQLIACKYGIDIGSVDLEERVDESEIVETPVDQQTVNVPTWKARLCWCIGYNFRTKVYKRSTRYGGSEMLLIGLKEDVEITKYMIEYAINSFEKMFKKYLAELKSNDDIEKVLGYRVQTQSDSLKVRNDYFEGFLCGLDEAFKKNVEKYELVVVAPNSVVDYVKEKYEGKVENATVNPGKGFKDMSHMIRGFKDGKTAGESKDKLLT